MPEIIYDLSLFLSPHVFLLAILFKYRAFEVEGLNDHPHKLNMLRVSLKANELQLRLRDELNDVPLFRQAVKTVSGYEMSRDRAINQNITGDWMKKMGRMLGFEYTSTAYMLLTSQATAWTKAVCIFLLIQCLCV